MVLSPFAEAIDMMHMEPGTKKQNKRSTRPVALGSEYRCWLTRRCRATRAICQDRAGFSDHLGSSKGFGGYIGRIYLRATCENRLCDLRGHTDASQAPLSVQVVASQRPAV